MSSLCQYNVSVSSSGACNTCEMTNEDMVFFQNDLFQSAFPHMEEIRRQGKLCDVVLKVEGHSFSAHKIVLASTIPYFHAMFLNDMIESRTKEIEIQCIDAVALETLINFAYSGRVTIDKNNVEALMIGASYLQLMKVRDACAEYLIQRLHPQNAIGCKHFADTLGCNLLSTSAEKFVEMYFDQVAQHEEFLNLSANDVKLVLSKNELRVESEEQVFEACMRWVKHREDRREHMAQLLAVVRLPLLTPLYITDKVAVEEIIRNSLQCRDLVDEARIFHLIPERRSLIQSFKMSQRACEIKGHIYVVGGLNKHGESLSIVEYYDPKNACWYVASPMSVLRSRLGVAVLRTHLYALGGYNGKERLNSVEMYDTSKKMWTIVNPMQSKRSALGATSLGDEIYACGGYDGVTSLNSVERYHPLTNTWCLLEPMMKCRSAGAVVACQGYIYAIGGHDGLSIFDSVERYDPQTNSWMETTPMLTKRCRLGVATLKDRIYVCGGYDGSTFLRSVEMYNPETKKWSFVAAMNAPRSRVALTANMGKLWAVGGYDGLSNLSSMEVYDPNSDIWSFTTSMVAHEGGVGVGVISLY